MSAPTLDPEGACHPRALVAPAVSAILLARPLPAVPPAASTGLAEFLAGLGLAGLAFAEGTSRPAPAFHEALRTATTGAAFRTALTLDAARRALAVLREAGVEAVLFKGAALYRAGVYRDPRARPIADADLLVHPRQAGDAVGALESSGFRPWEPWTPSHTGWVSAFTLDDASAPAGIPVSLDLHWATDYTRLRHGPGWEGDVLWDRCAPPLPAPEAHFVVTAEHLLKHLRVAVHFPALADLVRLLPHLEAPDRVARHAGSRGSLPGLRAVVGLLLALGASIPAELTRAVGGVRIATASARRARLSIPELLARTAECRGALRRPRSTSLRDWFVPSGPGGALRETLRVLMPPGAWLRARYPRGSTPWARRRRYVGDLVRWAASSGPSPLSPNQGLR